MFNWLLGKKTIFKRKGENTRQGYAVVTDKDNISHRILVQGGACWWYSYSGDRRRGITDVRVRYEKFLKESFKKNFFLKDGCAIPVAEIKKICLVDITDCYDEYEETVRVGGLFGERSKGSK